MTVKKERIKKGLSLFLCVALCVCTLPFAFSQRTYATEQSDTRVADPSTMDGWKQIFSLENPTTEYAGGIWTDKSVFVSDDAFDGILNMQDDENNFLVALSAIASEQSVTGYSQIPTDTVFVLDVSRSMGANVQPGDNNNDAVDELVKATNEAMAKLLGANNNNRVGVVLYSGTYSSDVAADESNAMVLLPLGRYEQADNVFVEKDNHIFSVGQTMRTAESIRVNAEVTSLGVQAEQNEREVFGGTFVQGGVYAAMNEFLSVEDTEIFGEQFQAGTKRLPVMVLMADGVATSATTNYMGDAGSIGISDMGNGNTPEDELETAIPFVTQLTCSYAKEKMQEHYGREPLFYTLGYNVKSTPVLDPKNTTTDEHWNTYDITETGSLMQLAVKSTWISNGWWGEGHWDEEYKTVLRSEYDLNKNYADKYFYTDNDLIGVFGDITDEILNKSLYYPTQVANGNIHHDGYVEFIDDIGQFMEVKKVHGILLSDVLFTGDNIASNFTEGVGGNLGTIDNPSDLGNEMIRSVKARLGIDTKEAQELVRKAYVTKQLRYDSETGEWSNYIGWYADAEGKYLGHGTRDDSTPLEGAVFYNESYGYLGQVTDGYKNSDMMYVSVQIHTRIATGTSAVIFRIPASLLPVINYNVTLTGESLKDPGEITLTVSDTVKKDTDNDGDFDAQVHASPIRLVFEVGLKDYINETNVASVVGEGYKYSKDGTYDFYVSRWNPSDINHANPSVAENTVSFFEPSSDNGRYYYAENTTVYIKSGDEYVPYKGKISPADTSDTYYREYAVFEQMNDKEQGNARLHLHYEEMSAEALSVAKSKDTALCETSTWYVPKGTIHRTYHNHHVGKGGFTDDTKTQVNSNNTNTVMYSHYLGVEKVVLENGEVSYYADVVHGNNGKISVKQAQGIKISASADITLAEYDEAFCFELFCDSLQGSVRVITENADGSTQVSAAEFEGGKLTVSLNGGCSAYILDIPEGTMVNIREVQEDNEYRVKSVNGENKAEITLCVEEKELSQAEFVNTLENPEGCSALVLYNTIEHPFGEDYEVPENIVFGYNIKYVTEAGEVKTEGVTLEPEQVVRITDIPLGAKVEITETGLNRGFTTDAENNTKTFIAEKEENYIAEFKNIYTPDSVSPHIEVNCVKNLYGREDAEWLEEDKFTFKLQKLVGDKWIDMALAVASADNREFDFDRILESEVYSQAGVYSYRIVESFDENPYKGITYDKSVRWFDVFVSDKDMDGALEIGDVVPYMGTTADFDDESGLWKIKTAFTNNYAAAGSDAVSVVVKNRFVNSSTGEEDTSVSRAGYEFGLYQNERLITVLPATSEAGETMVTLTYGTLDMGKHIHYELRPIASDNLIEDAEYSNQGYNISVEVQDDTQGGIMAVLTVTEDKDGAVPVSAKEVEVEFTNYITTQVLPPEDKPTDSDDKPAKPTEPVIPEPSDDPESSVGEKPSAKPDVPDTGFFAAFDNILWILFFVVFAVSLAGVIFTSKRK